MLKSTFKKAIHLGRNTIPLNAGYGTFTGSSDGTVGRGCHLSVHGMSCLAREGRLSHSHLLSIDQGEAWVGRRCLACSPGWSGPPRPGTRTQNLARTTGLRRHARCQWPNWLLMKWLLPHITHPFGLCRGPWPHEVQAALLLAFHPGVPWASNKRVIACRQTGVQLDWPSRSGGTIGAKGGPPSGFQTKSEWGSATTASHSRHDTSRALKHQPAGGAWVFDDDWWPGPQGQTFQTGQETGWSQPWARYLSRNSHGRIQAIPASPGTEPGIVSPPS